MSDLTVIVPSRGRPQNIERLLEAWRDTDAHASLLVVIDEDDPTGPQYPGVPLRVERKRLGPTLNEVAATVSSRFVGFMGDDHVPLTPHWDVTICETLAEMRTGIAYGDDGLQHERLPTAVFMTTNIVNAVGYMAIPECKHLYLDDQWREWGTRAGCLRYLPNVSIEHRHPGAGKAAWDDRYAEVNSGAQDAADHAAYNAYCLNQMDIDVAKIQQLMQ